jgi:hypothetical protein
VKRFLSVVVDRQRPLCFACQNLGAKKPKCGMHNIGGSRPLNT